MDVLPYQADGPKLFQHKANAIENSVNRAAQVITEPLDERGVQTMALRAGQFSLHHGLCPHRSGPNMAGFRRIGLGMNFIRPQDTKPVFHSSALTGGEAKIFFEIEAHTVRIADMRKVGETLSLDREGFELLRHETAVEDLYDDDAVSGAYTREVEALLKRKLGASKVVVFDVTRRSDGGPGAPNPDGLRGPAARVHVDNDPWCSWSIRDRQIGGRDLVVTLFFHGEELIQDAWFDKAAKEDG